MQASTNRPPSGDPEGSAGKSRRAGAGTKDAPKPKRARPRYTVVEERLALLFPPGTTSADGEVPDVAPEPVAVVVRVHLADDVEAPTWKDATSAVADTLPEDRRYGRFATALTKDVPPAKKRNKVVNVSDDYE